MERNLFAMLSVGLGQWEARDYSYPYPEIMQHGLNILAARMMGSYPVSVVDLLHLFEKRLEEWYRWELPDGIDSRFSLMSDGRLDEQTIEYLLSENLPSFTKDSLRHLLVHNDNKQVVDLVEKARRAYELNPDQAELDYVQARQFLIENPFTTPTEFNDALYLSPFINELRDMYQEVDNFQEMFAYGSGDAGKTMWCCSVCGVLRTRKGQLQSIKPSTCVLRCPGSGEWTSIMPDKDIRVLKTGIQLRTMIPGIIELAEYNWLQALKSENHRRINQVSLWPGVDRYDLRIVFGDGDVWAVDIKDYKSPSMLGKECGHFPLYHADDRINWTKAFYVVPSDREDSWPGYLDIVRNSASQTKRIDFMTTRQFEHAVQNKLAELG